jgi:transcriptional activator protein UGA3
VSPVQQHMLVQDPTRMRVTHTRSTDGCENCFKRHKKCDQKLPVCTDCLRLRIECVPRRKDDNRKTHRKIESSPSSQVSPQFSSPEATHRTPATPVDSRSPNFNDWIALVDEDESANRASRPNLSHSSALKYVPELYKGQQLADATSSLQINALSKYTGVRAEQVCDWTVGDRHLFNHFLQAISRALVVGGDDINPYLRYIAPMAFQSTAVRHALLTVSASHLSKVYPDFENDLLYHRSMVFDQLKLELERNGNTVHILATALLLCLLEICEGRSRKWLLHLRGSQVLVSQLQEVDREPVAIFLADLCRYLCCVTSVTSHLVPLTLSGFDREHGFDAGSPTTQLHPLFGVCDPIYHLIAVISKLRRERSGREGSSDQTASQDVASLMQALDRWTAPDTTDRSNEFGEAIAGAVCMKWGATLYARWTLLGEQTDTSDQIQTATRSILSELSIIRPGSHMCTHLLFPLMMAGLGSLSKGDRLTVEYRLNLIEGLLGFGNITVLHKLLDEVWTRANRLEKVDWEHLLQTTYPSLALI